MGADGRHGARREGHRHRRVDLPSVAASCDNPHMADPRIAPASVRAALRRGIDLYNAGRGGKGLVDDTVDWARALAIGAKITYPKAVKMRGWFARHGPWATCAGSKTTRPRSLRTNPPRPRAPTGGWPLAAPCAAGLRRPRARSGGGRPRTRGRASEEIDRGLARKQMAPAEEPRRTA